MVLTGHLATAQTRSTGVASWYGTAAHEGRRMASGCPYRAGRLTAASRTLPLGAWVAVRSQRSGRSVLVQITDRGPYRSGRIIDMSRAAADALGMRHAGLARVTVEMVGIGPVRC